MYLKYISGERFAVRERVCVEKWCFDARLSLYRSQPNYNTSQALPLSIPANSGAPNTADMFLHALDGCHLGFRGVKVV
jgi:hypothetical protein